MRSIDCKTSVAPVDAILKLTVTWVSPAVTVEEKSRRAAMANHYERLAQELSLTLAPSVQMCVRTE